MLSSQNNSYKLFLVTQLDDLSLLEDEWNVLESDIGYPLSGYHWSYYCAKYLYDHQNLRILVLTSDHCIEAIAPMAINKVRSVPRMETLGSSFLFEPCKLLYRSPQALKILVHNLVDFKYPFYLHRISSKSPVIDHLKGYHKKAGIFIARPSSGSGYISINTDWDTYFSNLSSSKRYDIRRKLKIAQKFGKVDFRFFNPNETEIASLLPVAFKLEGSGWKRQQKSDLMSNKPNFRFFSDFLSKAASKKQLRIGFMYIDEEPVSVVIGLVVFEKFWLLKNGYDPVWKACSPGILLMNAAIKYCFDCHLKKFEFLGGYEQFVHRFVGNCFHEYTSLAFFPYSLTGLSLLGLETLAHFLRKAIRALAYHQSEKT